MNKLLRDVGNDLNGESIRAQDLPKDIIDISHKKKVLKAKRYCRRLLINDTTSCIAVFGMLGLFITTLLRAEEIDTNGSVIALLIVMFGAIIYFVGKILITLPRRIRNYVSFNFERTCYATIVNRYTRTTSNKNGSSTTYYADLQLGDGKYIKSAKIIGSSRYFRLKSGDRVIAVSFDGYRTYVIELNDYEEKPFFM